jgi:hypothetical protein
MVCKIKNLETVSKPYRVPFEIRAIPPAKLLPKLRKVSARKIFFFDFLFFLKV